MKKIINGFLLYVLLLCSCATGGSGGGGLLSLDEAIELSARNVAERLPAGTRIAIVAFEAEHDNIAGYIMDELTAALVNIPIEVADRNNLEYVYKELNFQMSGDVSDETALSIGKFLGAKYVITGQMVNTGNRYRYRVNTIVTETARHEANVSLNVRRDQALGTMFAALQKNTAVTRTAKYAVTENTKPATAGTWLDQGIMFASRGEYDRAIECFTEAIKLDPDMQAAYKLRARALIFSVSKVSNIGANFSGGTIRDAMDRTATGGQQGIYDRAIADYTQAIRINPNDVDAYNGSGIAYFYKGDYDRAIADFNQAIRINPNDVDAYNGRGVAYYGKGDYDRAIADYTQAIRIDPNFAVVYYNRGITYSNKGDHDRAIVDYTQAIRLDSNHAQAYSNRGNAYGEKGDHDRAVADYTQAIRLDPNNTTAYSNRGIAYYIKGDYDRVIADYTQVIRLDPNDAIAYSNRGVAYYIKGNYDRAIADFEAALKIDPYNAQARQNIEKARQMRGY